MNKQAGQIDGTDSGRRMETGQQCDRARSRQSHKYLRTTDRNAGCEKHDAAHTKHRLVRRPYRELELL